MNANPLVINNDTGSKQRCKGCEKNVPFSLFITNEKSYKTCNTCRTQNKAFYRQKLQKSNDQILIEFNDLGDYLSEVFDALENEAIENQENEENVFAFSCAINIITLEGNNSKEKADCIVKVISDVD